jgi:hypothetical protein
MIPEARLVHIPYNQRVSAVTFITDHSVYLLMNVQFPEDFRRVEKMLVLKDPFHKVSFAPYTRNEQWSLLLRVPRQERQIQEQSQPVSVDEEQCG